MTGREEHDKLFRRQITDYLLDLPPYVDEWYNNMLASGTSIRTCADYIYIILCYMKSIDCDTLEIEPESLTPVSLDKYFISLKHIIKNGTTQKASDSRSIQAWYALKNFFEFLTNREYIEKNYVKLITKPKNRDEARIKEQRVLLNKDDFTKIINAALADKHKNCKRNVLMLGLLMSTGMRKSALIEINMEDIDFVNKKLYVVDKGEKRHEYVLSPKIINMLEDYLNSERFEIDPDMIAKPLFINNYLNRITVDIVKYAVKKYTKIALGKELSPHKFRAGFCSILYEETHDAEFVRRAVGHSNIATTQRYIVTDNKEKEKASSIIDDIL